MPPAADVPEEEEPVEPGVSQAIGDVRAAFMRMIDAHVALLRAELEIFGKELGIIVGLAGAAIAIAILAALLLYVGSFLFFGDNKGSFFFTSSAMAYICFLMYGT